MRSSSSSEISDSSENARTIPATQSNGTPKKKLTNSATSSPKLIKQSQKS